MQLLDQTSVNANGEKVLPRCLDSVESGNQCAPSSETRELAGSNLVDGLTPPDRTAPA